MNRLVIILGPCLVYQAEKGFKKHWRKNAALSDTITVIKAFTSLKSLFNGRANKNDTREILVFTCLFSRQSFAVLVSN